MNETLRKLCIKISKGDDLATCLNKSVKDRIKEILNTYGVKAAASAKKDELTAKAVEAVTAGAADFLAGDGAAYAETFGEILSGDARISSEPDARIDALFERGLVFFAQDGDDAAIIVPSDLTGIAKGRKSAKTSSAEALSEALAISPEERNTHTSEKQTGGTAEERTEQDEDVIRFARSLSNIYGVYPVTQLKAILDFSYGKALSPNEIMDALEKSSEADGFYMDNQYIVSDLLPDVEAYHTVLDSLQQGDTYYYAKKEIVEEYENGVIYDDGVDHKFFRNYLLRKLGDPESADAAIRRFFLAAMKDSAPADLMTEASEIGLTFDDNDDMNRMIDLYTSWFYGLRSWFCKGYKPMELIIDKMQTRNIKLPANVNPMKRVKVGRNDKCPCGSGRKFKSCCGKGEL